MRHCNLVLFFFAVSINDDSDIDEPTLATQQSQTTEANTFFLCSYIIYRENL